MKKLVLMGAAAVALTAMAAASPAQAFGGGFKGCCGGWQGGKGFGGGFGGGWHHGGGLSVGLIGLDSDVGGDCYYVRRAVLVPGIGVVNRRQLVCS
jgi:hypothetical protein